MENTPQFSMSEEDYENLNFLLSISNETFNDWWDTVDEDDRDYALTLLKVAEHEIIEMAQKKTGDLSLANQVLSKFHQVK